MLPYNGEAQCTTKPQSKVRAGSFTDEQKEQHSSRPKDIDCDILTEAWRHETGGREEEEAVVTVGGRERREEE